MKKKLLEDNIKEEKEIKKLEKFLRLGRKGEVFSSSFKMEGFDCIFVICFY